MCVCVCVYTNVYTCVTIRVCVLDEEFAFAIEEGINPFVFLTLNVNTRVCCFSYVCVVTSLREGKIYTNTSITPISNEPSVIFACFLRCSVNTDHATQYNL